MELEVVQWESTCRFPKPSEDHPNYYEIYTYSPFELQDHCLIPLNYSIKLPPGYEMFFYPLDVLATRHGVTVSPRPILQYDDLWISQKVHQLYVRMDIREDQYYQFGPDDPICLATIMKLERFDIVDKTERVDVGENVETFVQNMVDELSDDVAEIQKSQDNESNSQ